LLVFEAERGRFAVVVPADRGRRFVSNEVVVS
jgi:hypothetical protein